MQSFSAELRTQRWDDHRYYHHSRINQSLHLLSAISFLIAYVMMFTDPVKAALIGWLVAMVSRQSGHFFFEPKGYDEVNHATHEHKEDIKVGYNLRRKVILHAVWALVARAACGWIPRSSACSRRRPAARSFVRHMGEIWLIVGIGALLFRTVQLFFLKDVQTGLVWLTKIVTDPFNDVKIYCKAPLYLLRGELIDPGELVEPADSPAGLKHLLEHAAFDGLVGELGLGPPPAVVLHRAGRRHESVGDLREVRGGVIQAEDQAPGAHPAQARARARAGSIETSSCSATAAGSRPSRSSRGSPPCTGNSSALSRSLSPRARSFQTSSRSRYSACIGSVARRCRNSYMAPIT